MKVRIRVHRRNETNMGCHSPRKDIRKGSHAASIPLYPRVLVDSRRLK